VPRSQPPQCRRLNRAHSPAAPMSLRSNAPGPASAHGGPANREVPAAAAAASPLVPLLDAGEQPAEEFRAAGVASLTTHASAAAAPSQGQGSSPPASADADGCSEHVARAAVPVAPLAARSTDGTRSVWNAQGQLAHVPLTACLTRDWRVAASRACTHPALFLFSVCACVRSVIPPSDVHTCCGCGPREPRRVSPQRGRSCRCRRRRRPGRVR